MRDKRSSSKSSRGRKVCRRRTSFHKAEHSISAILQGDHLAPRHKRGAFCGALSMFDNLEVKVLCAGINRHEVENVRVSRERTSDLLGPEFCTKRREALSEA